MIWLHSTRHSTRHLTRRLPGVRPYGRGTRKGRASGCDGAGCAQKLRDASTSHFSVSKYHSSEGFGLRSENPDIGDEGPSRSQKLQKFGWDMLRFHWSIDPTWMFLLNSSVGSRFGLVAMTSCRCQDFRLSWKAFRDITASRLNLWEMEYGLRSMCFLIVASFDCQVLTANAISTEPIKAEAELMWKLSVHNF